MPSVEYNLENHWRTQAFRQSVVCKLQQLIQQSSVQLPRTCSDMENHVYMKAKTKEEYMNMVAKIVIHIREMSSASQDEFTTTTNSLQNLNL